MTSIADGPMFAPDFFEIGPGCLWRHEYEAPLSMNEWFITGPGPGVERSDWLHAALAYRKQALAGKGRYLAMNGADGNGWLRLAEPLAETLSLKSGDGLFLSVTARSVEGRNRLRFFVDHPNGARTLAASAQLDLPDDGEWHELSLTLDLPELEAETGTIRPGLLLESAEADGPARADLAGVILGVDDTARMGAFGQMLRALDTTHVCRCVYDREDLRWTLSAFSAYFLFLYDRRFWQPGEGYRVDAFMEEMRERFGGVETVILWPAYPRIGADDRNQFDFFRDMPGGLEGLKEVCHSFHEHGVRVQIPLLPWDKGTRREDRPDTAVIAELVAQLEADGVFLDTLTGADSALRQAVDARRAGVALVPELGPPVRQLSLCNLSWAQWAHDPEPPGMPQLKWIEPRHIQHFTKRWETSHRDEIETAFFNGAGILLWENIFGTANPVSGEDALLWKRCASILRAFPEVFTSTLWDPFYPAVQEDMYVHRWPGAPTTLFTLRNFGEPLEHGPLLRWQFPEERRADDMHVYDLWQGRQTRWEMTEFGTVQVWGDMDRLGCIAVTFGDDPRLEAFLAAQATLAEQEAPVPRPPLYPAPRPQTTAQPSGGKGTGMVRIPGGAQRMRIQHTRRECGCYPDPGTPEEEKGRFTRGTPHDEMLEHDYTVEVPEFLIDEAQVSNADFNRFLKETGYRPEHPENFLRHWPDGVMPEAVAELPVVYVDLEDARAYARWAGKRLPAEAEWQRAAQGEDGRIWPWGNDFDPAKCATATSGPMPVRSLPEGRGPRGLYHTSGNVWEWTESEYEDEYTRFCILRGGSWYRPSGSGWYMPGGPQPLNAHAKFLLLWPGLDRCATIGFRCAKDIQ